MMFILIGNCILVYWVKFNRRLIAKETHPAVKTKILMKGKLIAKVV